MIHKIGKTKWDIYALDYETHNDTELLHQFEKSPLSVETSIWLGYLINEKNTYKDGYFLNMEGFFERLKELSTTNRKERSKHILIYVYNLSFEWNFILSYISKMGFQFKEAFEESDCNVYNSITTKSVSSVWEARLKVLPNNSVIVFRDINKILSSGTLRGVAKSFGLETQKGDIEYTKNRRYYYIDDYPIYYSPYIPTIEEMIYCFKDCRIIIELLQIMIAKGDKEFFTALSASSYSAQVMIKKGYEKFRKPYAMYRLQYPELSEEENNFLRKGTSGGISYPTPKYQFKQINQKIFHIDAHQMHPTQMYQHKFPYGKGTYINLEKVNIPESVLKRGYLFKNKQAMLHIAIKYDEVILHSVISLIGINTAPVEIELHVWDFEIAMMYKCYKGLKIRVIEGYYYKTKYLPFRELVANNYRERLKAKKVKDGYLTNYYKLLNNGFYGKLLEHPHNTILMNVILEGISTSIEIPKEDIAINAKYTYLPVGSSIPAHSRVSLLEAAFKLSPDGSKVIYFDTDSVFAIYDEDVEKRWNTLFNQEDFLGGWGLEEISDRGQFVTPKRYKLEANGEKIVHAAGFNTELFKDLSYDDVMLIDNKMAIKRAYKCKGGMIVAFQKKLLNVPEKYKFVYEENKYKVLEAMPRC